MTAAPSDAQPKACSRRRLPCRGLGRAVLALLVLLAPHHGRAGSPAGLPPCDYQIGWTRDVTGGLGGALLRVTSLEREGPGTLAEALATPGPRTVVFEVGGVVDLQGRDLVVTEPFLTVAGQTAPAPGITLVRGSLVIASHDVVVQHLAVRPGAAGQPVGWEPDAISLSAAHDVVIDHCSTTWAVDENLSASGPRFEGDTPDDWRANTSHRVTFTHNLVAEALSRATHGKGEHSKGSLVHDNVTDVLIHANLYASNVDRNPHFKGGARGAVVNNLLVNPGTFAMSYVLVPFEWTGFDPQEGRLSVVGNVSRAGLDSARGQPLLVTLGPLALHLSDNESTALDGSPLPEWLDVTTGVRLLDEPPAWPEGLQPMPSDEVEAYLEDHVGPRPWDRSPTDARIVHEAFAGTTRVIDHEDEVGGFPEPGPPTRAPFDPDAWDACLRRLPPPLPVAIDIRPRSPANRLNPLGRGRIRVALLGSEDFDVGDVDPASLVFGPAAAAPVGRRGPTLRDVNRDGEPDLVARFRVAETGIAPGETEACLGGRLVGDRWLEGCDGIRTRSPACALGIEGILAVVALRSLLPAPCRRRSAKRWDRPAKA